jgi:hypothetical protein
LQQAAVTATAPAAGGRSSPCSGCCSVLFNSWCWCSCSRYVSPQPLLQHVADFVSLVYLSCSAGAA